MAGEGEERQRQRERDKDVFYHRDKLGTLATRGWVGPSSPDEALCE